MAAHRLGRIPNLSVGTGSVCAGRGRKKKSEERKKINCLQCGVSDRVSR